MKIIKPYNPDAFGKKIDKNEDLGQIAHILFKENYTRIGDNAFKNCTDLTEIYIPDNVTTIYNTAFANCKELRIINFGNTRTTVAGLSSGTGGEGLQKLFNLDYDIVVPDDLYDVWITKSVWPSNMFKPHIIKYSDYKYHPENHYRLFNKIKFSSASNGSVLGYKCEGNFIVTLYKSFDGQHWARWDGSDIVLNSGEFVYVYGDNPNGMASSNDSLANTDYCHFTGTGNLTVEGNVMSLLYINGSQTLSTNHALRYLFKGMTGLVHSKDLLLPATTTKYGCYGCMFQNCTSLVDTPELPATTLNGACYWCMFDGCTSLIAGPSELPALSVPGNAYQCLFRGCSSLTSAPIISATSVGQASCNSMFMNCSSLTTAPELLATTIGKGCYEEMFFGCTSLNKIPILPATVLKPDCYKYMFRKCTSLTIIPSIMLPATTLDTYCYYGMFMECTALTNVPELSVQVLTTGCYGFMFRQCSSLTTAPELPATTLANNCYNQMFSFCTSLTTAPVLPAKTLVANCYTSMFNSCSHLNHIECYAVDGFDATDCLTNWTSAVSNTGTFVKAALVDDWTRGSSGIPTNWIVQEHINDNEIIYQSIEE